MEDQNQSGNLPSIMLGAIALGIILLVIGLDSQTGALVDIGLIATTIALFGGGFLLDKEDTNMRVGMLISGAIVLGFALSSSFAVAIF